MSKGRQIKANGQTLWSKEKIAELIKLYHQHECLWNHYTESYKDKAKRQDAINSICSTLGISTLAYGKKIHNLRNQFNSEMKKFERCLDESGNANTSDVVAHAALNCRWMHFDSLKFLAKVIEPRPTGFEAKFQSAWNKSSDGAGRVLRQHKEEQESILPDDNSTYEIEMSGETECDETQAEQVAMVELQNYISEDELPAEGKAMNPIENGRNKLHIQSVVSYAQPKQKQRPQQAQPPVNLNTQDKPNRLPTGAVVEFPAQQASPPPATAVAQDTTSRNEIKQQQEYKEHKEQTNYFEPRDHWDAFGSLVATEIRNLNSEQSRKKLKRKIMQALLEVGEEDDELAAADRKCIG